MFCRLILDLSFHIFYAAEMFGKVRSPQILNFTGNTVDKVSYVAALLLGTFLEVMVTTSQHSITAKLIFPPTGSGPKPYLVLKNDDKYCDFFLCVCENSVKTTHDVNCFRSNNVILLQTQYVRQ